MSDSPADRLSKWEQHGTGQWGRGVACDILALEARVAALEEFARRISTTAARAGEQVTADLEKAKANSPATPDSSPAADGEWRMLEVGEVISSDDEWASMSGWGPATVLAGHRVLKHAVGNVRRRVKPATPAPDGDALRAECDRLRAENVALRQRLAAPVDVEAFRGEFEQWFKLNYRDRGMENWDPFRDGIYWLASRLNAAARKEVGGE